MLPNIQNNNAFLMAMGSGSRIEIHAAAAEKESWTQIDQTAEAGDNQLVLAEATGWQVGDRIAIASSGFDMEEAEERTITAISDDGLIMTLDSPLDHRHHGEIETYDNGLSGAAFREWDLDMRAEVALLSRNVTIQGDADSEQDGYGGHTMIMMGAEMHIDGAELTQMGQKGALGRYPLHWHMLGDASGQYITNSSIHTTYNKGMTIHGTQNTWVENNVIHDTIGHSYYFEDGSEFGNVLKDNLGMTTRAAESVSAAPIGSDHTAVSTYWVTNPQNHLIGNHAAGSDEAGFWVLSQDHTEGLSAASGLYDDYAPREQTPGHWVGNSSHSNGADGFFLGGQFDESTGQRFGVDPRLEQPFALTDFTTYKNTEIGIWVRNGLGDYSDIKVAESNKGAQIWGAGHFSDSLFVGQTDNFEYRPRGEYVGWELYDQGTHLDGVHFEGFSGALDAAIGQGSGFGRSTNNSIDDATFGDDVPEDNFYRGKTVSNQNNGLQDKGGSLAGALHDMTGSLTGEVGAIITPGIVDYTPNRFADVLNHAFDGIEASGFNASAGAVWLPDSTAWVNPAGSVIGKMIFRTSNNANDRVGFTIGRSDNGAEIFYGRETQEGNGRAQLNIDASGDVEYVVSYPEGLPDEISIEVLDLPNGATAYYRFQGLPEDVALQRATPVADADALRAADETSWYRDDNGDFVVKIFAEEFFPWWITRSEEMEATGELYHDTFKIQIEDRASANPSNNRDPFAEPGDHWAPADPVPVPDRAASTSNTVQEGAPDLRWSDPSAWENGVPGAGDTVIIGPGRRVILDTDAAVTGIIVNGGELVVEDSRDIALAADWILVINGGIFQVGTEDNPFEHDFELTLEGDDPGNDVNVGQLVASEADNIVRAIGATYETDEIIGADRGETVSGLTGNDLLDLAGGNDVAYGGAGSDLLLGGAGDDMLSGGEGFDAIEGGPGADQLFGGTGGNAIEGDIVTYFGATGPLVFNFGSIIPQILAGSSQEVLEDTIGNDIEGVDGASNYSNTFNAESLTGVTLFLGGAEADTFNGGSGVDQLLGLGGDDAIFGNDGGDALIGEGGDDDLYGGAGADVFFFDGINDGNDTIHDFELGVDRVFFTGGNVSASDMTIRDTDAGGNGTPDALLEYNANGQLAGSITIIDHDATSVLADALIVFG